MKLEWPRHIFEKHWNNKFHENHFIESRVVPRGWTEEQTEGQTDMKKLIAAFSNLAKALKNKYGSNFKLFLSENTSDLENRK